MSGFPPMTRFFATRPMEPFDLGRWWQAARGPDRFGPVQPFFVDAVADLPPEAEATVDFEAGTFRCDDRWRVAPVDDLAIRFPQFIIGAEFRRVRNEMGKL